MIEGKNIKRTFVNGKIVTPVLKGIDIKINEGEFVAIMGRSGAGKSTLLYQLSLLDTPTEGEVFVDGKNTSTMTQSQKTKFRLKNLGFVFQDYALIPELTAEENVALPLIMQNIPKVEAYARAHEVLESVGLEGRHTNLPTQLSGGEQQRVSVARSIVHEPAVIFADEPTANLDKTSADNVIEILKGISKNSNQTIVMVTHEEEYGKEADRIVFLGDGKIEKEM